MRLLIITLSSLFLISCGSDSVSGEKAKSTTGAELRSKKQANAVTLEDQNSVTLNSEVSSWGRVYINTLTASDTQDEFYAHLQSLLSPQLDANEIGSVDGSQNADDGSGIAFFGKNLNYKEGLFDPAVISQSKDQRERANIFDAATAEFRLSIYHLVGAEGNKQIDEIPIHFNSAPGVEETGRLVESYATENYIQLIFQDAYGKVSVGGDITQDSNGEYIYEGELIFRNLKDKAGNDVIQDVEVLGRFRVRACGFFTCQSN